MQPHLGNLDDMESLRSAAGAADGVIHLAFMHSLSQIPFGQRLRIILGGLPTGIVSRFLAVSAEADQRAIDTIGAALKGSGRPLVTTFGTMGLSHVGFRAVKPATEEDEPDPLSPGIVRAKTEEKVEALASLGVRATMVRLAPSVHGEGDTGLVPQLIGIARKRGQSGYIGDGQNRWPAVHRRDAARLFRLALEKGRGGALSRCSRRGNPVPFHRRSDWPSTQHPGRLHIGERSGEPIQYFWGFAATDNPSSSTLTRAQLGWEPTGPGLLTDLNAPGYYVTIVECKTRENATGQHHKISCRASWFVPLFAFHAQRSISQIRSAEGCMALALLKDKNRTFWTMTMWTDERSMKSYMTSGAHRKAMPRLAEWADEASVVHWQQDHPERPGWPEAARRMRAEGRPSKLRHPGPHHADLSFAEPWTTVDTFFETFPAD